MPSRLLSVLSNNYADSKQDTRMHTMPAPSLNRSVKQMHKMMMRLQNCQSITDAYVLLCVLHWLSVVKRAK